MERPLVFIVGSGRSGTTMLRLMLDAHPLVAVPHESFFVPKWIEEWPQLARGGRLDVDAALALARRDEHLEQMPVDPAEARRRLEALENPTAAEALDTVFRVYMESEGKETWGDKTPRNVTYVRKIARAFPRAKFVHLIRDGRDVWLSYKDADIGPDDLRKASYHWRDRVTQGRRQGLPLGPSRYYEMWYERLVEDPERELREMCRFLGIDYDPAMPRFHERTPRKYADPKPHQVNLRRGVTPGIRDWRSQMSAEDVRAYEAVAGPTLSAFGYERRFPSQPVERVKAFFETRKHWLRIKRGRLKIRTRAKRLIGA
ncbi:MAG: sulfotransferase [Actinomycetota bacterium]